MAVRPAEIAVARLPRARPGAWPVLARFARKKPLGAAGGVLMVVMVLTAVFADLLQSHDPIATNAAYTLGHPNAEHWLGTDHLGRDIYSRIVHGARVSLIVGLASTLLGSVLGGLVGRHLRSAFRHVLPNAVGPFIVLCTAQLGSAILVEATLSFLGLGVPEPYPSWGRMLSVSAAEYAQKAPHLVLFPGIAISLAVFGSNLFGDALRDVLDPRLRGA